MKVAICIITYKRPEGLVRLLNGLNCLCFERVACPEVNVHLVDNDLDGSAQSVYKTFEKDFQFSLTYDVEPQRGISYARNRSVAAIEEDTDFVVFIDDDEVPERSWLEELLVVQSQHDADVVHGRVVPHFQEDVPLWIKKGNFFEPYRYETGQSLEAAYTNNSLIKASLITSEGNVFDERFALTGGEDSYFFRTLHHHGHSLIWADKAVVYDWVPPSRMNMKWILMRAYRSCLTYTIWEKEIKASILTKIIVFCKAIAQIVLGLFMLLPSLFLRRHMIAKALLHLCKGAGRLSGLVGFRYKEYQTIHGS